MKMKYLQEALDYFETEMDEKVSKEIAGKVYL